MKSRFFSGAAALLLLVSACVGEDEKQNSDHVQEDDPAVERRKIHQISLSLNCPSGPLEGDFTTSRVPELFIHATLV